MGHITQPLDIWSIMATIRWCPLYSQNGTVTNPCNFPMKSPRTLGARPRSGSLEAFAMAPLKPATHKQPLATFLAMFFLGWIGCSIYYKVVPQFGIAKLVYKSNFTMVYGTYKDLVNGAYKPTNITGGPHIVGCSIYYQRSIIAINQ